MVAGRHRSCLSMCLSSEPRSTNIRDPHLNGSHTLSSHSLPVVAYASGNRGFILRCSHTAMLHVTVHWGNPFVGARLQRRAHRQQRRSSVRRSADSSKSSAATNAVRAVRVSSTSTAMACQVDDKEACQIMDCQRRLPDTERRGLPEWGLLGRCCALPMDALAVLIPDDGTGSAE